MKSANHWNSESNQLINPYSWNLPTDAGFYALRRYYRRTRDQVIIHSVISLLEEQSSSKNHDFFIRHGRKYLSVTFCPEFLYLKDQNWSQAHFLFMFLLYAPKISTNHTSSSTSLSIYNLLLSYTEDKDERYNLHLIMWDSLTVRISFYEKDIKFSVWGLDVDAYSG